VFKDVVIDPEAHGARVLWAFPALPILAGAREFVEAAAGAGIPSGDYNGRDRGGPVGIASLMQTTTRNGRRSEHLSRLHRSEAEHRANLTIIAGAQAARVVLRESSGKTAATAVEYRTPDGQIHTASALKEVISERWRGRLPASFNALRDRAPPKELEKAGRFLPRRFASRGEASEGPRPCSVVSFIRPHSGVRMSEVGVSLGPDALRQPRRPSPRPIRRKT